MKRFLLAALLAVPLLPAPAAAVVNGAVDRDPRGLRGSVVRIESSLGELCSGSLIGPDLVLTAAHCVMRRAAYAVVATDRAFRPRRVRAVAASMHPDFVPGTTPEDQPGVDLAILKLSERLGPDYAPFDPRATGRVRPGDAVDIAGYGVVAENRRGTARTLRQARLVAVGDLQVANRVLMVADRRNLAERVGAGACLGDSGGPILAGGPGGYQLLGVVSWSSGALRQDPKARTACGGFTAVTPLAEHTGWIAARASDLARLQPGDLVQPQSRADWSAR
jgi:hypothetical protein